MTTLQRDRRRRMRHHRQVLIPEHDGLFEIGLVDESTVVATFNFAVESSDYADGVTIEVNGIVATISSATRQSDHHVVYYVLSEPVDGNDVVTWAYDGSGDYASEVPAEAVPNFNRGVQNNVPLESPEVVSAEIGTVNDTTVVVVFTQNVLSPNYLELVIIKVNDEAVEVVSATRQVEHNKVYYVIPSVLSTDTVTWEYDANNGSYVNEDDGAAMPSLPPIEVVNNVV